MKRLFLYNDEAQELAQQLKNQDTKGARGFIRAYNEANEYENATPYYRTFGGHEVSEYGLKHGRLDYGTMSKCFDCVLCNNITQIDEFLFDNIESGDFEEYYHNGEQITRDEYDEALDQINEELDDLWGNDDEESEKRREELENMRDEYETTESEIFQYFIVSDNALSLLKEANELVFYSEKLDCYIWGVCHWGTSWDYVLTSIKLEKRED